MSQSNARATGPFNSFEGATRFGAMFTTPAQIADALWLVVFDHRQALDATTLHAQPLLRLRPGDRPVGLVAVHIGPTTPLDPTAILSIETARAVAAAIAADENWDQFCQALPADFAAALNTAADQAAAEASTPRLPYGDLRDA